MAPSPDSASLTKKKISDLRVIDLRAELEKRGLDKIGVKAALTERLSKALKEEGEDPDVFEFEVPAEATPVKKVVTKRVNKKPPQDAESETNDEAQEQGESEDEDEAEIETVDEDDDSQVESEARPKEESSMEGAEDAKAAGDAAAGSTHPEKQKENGKVSKNEKGDESRSAEPDQALIVHADDSHDLDNDIEEEDKQEKDGGGETKSTQQPKKADAAPAENEEAAKETTKKAAAATAAKKSTTPKVTKPAPKVEKELSRNLWVSGLANTTRAADLKALFGKYGKVTSAKIVTNAKTPGSRCYGYMTMGTAEEATKCVQHLHRTELHGKMISVERTKNEPGGALRRAEAKPAGAAAASATPAAKPAAPKETKEVKAKPAKAAEPKKKEPEKVKQAESKDEPEKAEAAEEEAEAVVEENAEEKEETEESEKAKKKHRDEKGRRRGSRSRSKERGGRTRRFFRPFNRGFRGSGFRRGIGRRPFFNKTSFRGGRMGSGEFRDNQSNFRADAATSFRQRELERRQREEALRIERERERLRVEREKLERERLDLLRLEREKQRLERERIQREREELRQRKLGRAVALEDVSRRPVKRAYEEEVRPARNDFGEGYWRENKRQHVRPEYENTMSRDRDDRKGSERYDRGGRGGFLPEPDFRAGGRPMVRERMRESPPGRRMEQRFAGKEGGFGSSGGSFGSGRFSGGDSWSGSHHQGSRGGGYPSSGAVGGGSQSWGSDMGRKADSSHDQSWQGQGERWGGAGGGSMGMRGMGGNMMGQGSQGYGGSSGGAGMMQHSGMGGSGGFGSTGGRYAGGSGMRRY